MKPEITREMFDLACKHMPLFPEQSPEFNFCFYVIEAYRVMLDERKYFSGFMKSEKENLYHDHEFNGMPC